MPDVKQIELFLQKVDCSFPIPLSQKQELGAFARKLCEKATICTVMENEKIVAMAAGYIENVVDQMGYISVVATVQEAQGKGYASRVISDFLLRARDQGLKAVHLYTSPTNKIALRMYERLGFERYDLENEPRPYDVHLLYRILQKTEGEKS